jgi:hypothetical protein
MQKNEYINHRKRYWLSQGFDDKVSDWISESDWRRYNTDKLQEDANKTR